MSFFRDHSFVSFVLNFFCPSELWPDPTSDFKIIIFIWKSSTTTSYPFKSTTAWTVWRFCLELEHPQPGSLKNPVGVCDLRCLRIDIFPHDRILRRRRIFSSMQVNQCKRRWDIQCRRKLSYDAYQSPRMQTQEESVKRTNAVQSTKHPIVTVGSGGRREGHEFGSVGLFGKVGGELFQICPFIARPYSYCSQHYCKSQKMREVG